MSRFFYSVLYQYVTVHYLPDLTASKIAPYSLSWGAECTIEMGKIKAEQIRRSGAKIVATNCFNCMTQIRDLNKAYDLGIEIKSIVELVSASLIL